MSDCAFDNGEVVQITNDIAASPDSEFEELNDKLDGELEQILARRLKREEAKIIWETFVKWIEFFGPFQNKNLAFDVLQFEAGLFLTEGRTLSDIAASHHTSRANANKIAIAIRERLNLPELSGMKSKSARKTYAKRAEQTHESRNAKYAAKYGCEVD